ncbi:hypothetical protein FHS55_002503 [Angulomicrobium tetraedrale]|uniref:Secreted protein n=1 Tax=Ancylobacter tetraedralis TaxID=217068 RepID=A0A839ZAX9_9HYPH|nr:hypothetical protein [Ancylobacter tetraedralis]MBB3771894.1 hypothetical protein [Ancylobacter tetraedralis]
MRAERNEATGLLRKVVTGAAAVAMLASSLASAQAANFFEKNFWLSGPNYSGKVPACDLPAAISEIRGRFATTESRFWNSSLKIDSFDHVREIAFRPWGEEYIPRRYCSAEVVISGTEGPVPHAPAQYNGGKAAGSTMVHPARHTIYYSLIEDGGFQSFSWGVEWCVEGFDRSWTYAPNCRMAQP